MKIYLEYLRNGLITENPVFIVALGLCPIFAVMTSTVNTVDMGLSSLIVLAFSNLVIFALSGVILEWVRLPVKIVVAAFLVTIVQLLVQGFVSPIYTALGVYTPLIIVSCIILGCAETYALGAKPISTFFDGLGMDFGFTLIPLLLDSLREIIGAGPIFGIKLIPDAYHISISILPPGALFAMAFLVAGMQYYQDDRYGKKSRPTSLEEAKTRVVRLVIEPATAAVAARATVATTAVKVKNPATEEREGTK